MSSPMIRTFASRSISSIIASRIASRYDFSLILTLAHRPRSVLRDDVIEQFRTLRRRTLLRERHRLRRLRGRPLIHLLHVIVREAADFAEAIAEDGDGIAVAMLLDFFLGAIRLLHIGGAVAGEAIR